MKRTGNRNYKRSYKGGISLATQYVIMQKLGRGIAILALSYWAYGKIFGGF